MWRRATAPVPARRRTTSGKRSAGRKSLFRGLPSAPIVLGIAALAVSVGGAVSAADPQLLGAAGHSSPAKIMQASAVSGAGGVASTSLLGSRGPVVSRDSRRDAQSDAAGADLVAEAEAQAKERTAPPAPSSRSAAEQYAAKLRLNLWQLPVASYHLTAGFGEYGLWSSYHTGLDFAAPSGTPIYAVANGTISSASYDGSYGNKTVETLDDGTELWYCHQTSFTVSSGEVVQAGRAHRLHRLHRPRHRPAPAPRGPSRRRRPGRPLHRPGRPRSAALGRRELAFA